MDYELQIKDFSKTCFTHISKSTYRNLDFLSSLENYGYNSLENSYLVEFRARFQLLHLFTFIARNHELPLRDALISD